LAFNLSCGDGPDATASQRFNFDLTQSAASGAIALITDSSLVRGGDSVDVTILASGDLSQAFLDVIANRRTLATEIIALEGGRAEAVVDLPADAIGTVELVAYSITAQGVLVRGQRLVYVEPANDLVLEMTADKDEYLPGETAQLSVRVTDQSGAGVTSAVGLSIVDEAVFALQDMRPGAERLFFQLEQELLTPDYETCGLDMGDVVDPTAATPEERDRTAEVLFAASGGSPAYAIAVDTLAEQNARAATIVRARLTADVEAIIASESEWITAAYNYGWNVSRRCRCIIAEMSERHYDPGASSPLTPVLVPDLQMHIQGAGPDEVLAATWPRRLAGWVLWDDQHRRFGGDGGMEGDGRVAACRSARRRPRRRPEPPGRRRWQRRRWTRAHLPGTRWSSRSPMATAKPSWMWPWPTALPPGAPRDWPARKMDSWGARRAAFASSSRSSSTSTSLSA
jgi:hypothetical protein